MRCDREAPKVIFSSPKLGGEGRVSTDGLGMSITQKNI